MKKEKYKYLELDFCARRNQPLLSFKMEWVDVPALISVLQRGLKKLEENKTQDELKENNKED